MNGIKYNIIQSEKFGETTSSWLVTKPGLKWNKGDGRKAREMVITGLKGMFELRIRFNKLLVN